jgi:hypothetical protein
MSDAAGVASKDFRRKSGRILGVLSLAVPILVAVLWAIVEANPRLGSGANGYAGLLIAIALYIGTLGGVVAGVTCGILSIVLEGNRLMGLLGIVASLVVGFWMSMHL